MAMQKPGEKPANSGEYLEVGSRGDPVPAACQVSIEKGDTPSVTGFVAFRANARDALCYRLRSSPCYRRDALGCRLRSSPCYRPGRPQLQALLLSGRA